MNLDMSNCSLYIDVSIQGNFISIILYNLLENYKIVEIVQYSQPYPYKIWKIILYDFPVVVYN